MHSENTKHLIFMFAYNIMSSGARWSDFVHGAGLLGGMHIDLIKDRKKKRSTLATYFLLSRS